MNCYLWFLLLFLLFVAYNPWCVSSFSGSGRFIFPSHKSTAPLSSSSSSSSSFVDSDDGVRLASLTKHSADAEYLRGAVKEYLDDEWLKQPVHENIAEEVSVCYKKERENGCDDLGEMLVSIGTTMESMDLSEAFIGPWDIGNLVCDLIMLRLEREVFGAEDLSKYSRPNPLHDGDTNSTDPAVFCVFTVKVSRPYPSVKVDHDILKEASKDYHDEFKRYKTLRDFLEGELSWKDMHPALALSMGFRVPGDDEQTIGDSKHIYQNQDVCPVGWGGLEDIPDLSLTTPDNRFIEQRLLNDLPEDEQSTDIIVETMVGLEMYKLTKFSKDPDVQRRYLVGKWLYVQGFLGSEFPVTEKFIPGHLREDGPELEKVVKF